jgi:hypothetical protein
MLENPRSPADSAPILVCAGISPRKGSAARALLNALWCSASDAEFAGWEAVEASFAIAASATA